MKRQFEMERRKDGKLYLDGEQHGLGARLSGHLDPGRQAYPVRLLTTIQEDHRYWNDDAWWGDQGQKPQCVGFAWMHRICDSPVRYLNEPPLAPDALYRWAQQLDEWPGEAYAGTSVNGGAKAAREAGLISSYEWCFDVPTLAHTVLTRGPVVMGTDWYSEMFNPVWEKDQDGTYRWFARVGGTLEGGHAYVCTGVNLSAQAFRFKNSWGRTWGSNGRFSMHFDDVGALLQANGEACIPNEGV